MDLYEQDFPSTVTEFYGLLERGSCLVLPLARGNTRGGIRGRGPQRDLQYAQAGAYIASHCQVLIALWNGITGGEGGAGETVRYALNEQEGPFAKAWRAPDSSDIPVVYRIVTPRRKNAEVVGKPFAIELLPTNNGEGTARCERFGRVVRQMDSFNRDCTRFAHRLAAEASESMEQLIPQRVADSLSPAAQRIRRLYGISDALATLFQRRSRGTLVGLFALALASVMSFEVYAHLLAEPWVFAFYPLALTAAWLLYRAMRERNVQNKYLDYRALAEGLRVQFFWRLSGVKEEVADHYLSNHRSELDWIRNAIRAWNVPSLQQCVPGHGAEPAEDCLDLVLTHWVRDQQAFFRGRRQRDRHGHEIHHRWASGLFLGGVGLGFLVLLADVFLRQQPLAHALHPWFVVFIGTLPAIAAAMGGYAEKMAFSAQAQRYAWMTALYDRAAAQLAAQLESGRLDDAKSLLFEIGREALEENGNWVLLRRERPLQIHF